MPWACSQCRGSEDLGLEAVIVEQFLDLLRLLLPLGGGELIGHGVVVVELDVVEAEVLEGLQLLNEFAFRPDGRTERIGARMQVPRPGGKLEIRFPAPCCGRGHCFLLLALNGLP